MKNLAVQFAEWIPSSGYIQIAKRLGGYWFKMKDPKKYTTEEVYDIFMEGREDHVLVALDLAIEHISDSSCEISQVDFLYIQNALKSIKRTHENPVLERNQPEKL